MIIKNKLGSFEFDEEVSETHATLIAATVMGQWYNPKPGEPKLSDEQSIYAFIRERCGNVLSPIGFDFEFNPNVIEREMLDRLTDAIAKIKRTQIARDERVRAQMDHENKTIQQLKAAFPGSWLVGPAAVK
jgi:hypothetical protein